MCLPVCPGVSPTSRSAIIKSSNDDGCSKDVSVLDFVRSSQTATVNTEDFELIEGLANSMSDKIALCKYYDYNSFPLVALIHYF